MSGVVGVGGVAHLQHSIFECGATCHAVSDLVNIDGARAQIFYDKIIFGVLFLFAETLVTITLRDCQKTLSTLYLIWKNCKYGVRGVRLHRFVVRRQPPFE